MYQRDMGVPGGARVDPEPKGMILRQTHVIGAPLIHESESAGWRRVPRVRWNHIESCLQPCLKRVIHSWRGGRRLQAYSLLYGLEHRTGIGRQIRKWRSWFLTHGASVIAHASFAQLASGERKQRASGATSI